MSSNQLLQSRVRMTIIFGGVVNVFLSAVKIVVGTEGHSHALVADGIHSLSDLATDFLVYIAANLGQQQADEKHPYGHGRFETVATSLLALILLLVALGIAYDAIDSLVTKEVVAPNMLVVSVAMLSVFLKELLYRYTAHVAKKASSNLLMANAWHHRSDAASSVVVVIAVVGVYYGFVYLDALAAIIVSGMIIRMAYQLMRESFKELVDSAVDEQTLAEIRRLLHATPGVQDVHQLRTRLIGGKIFVDVHLLVPPKITVSEGHFIGQRAHANLVGKMEHVVDVTVHIDPEDDEVVAPSESLKTRDELLDDLLPLLEPVYASEQIKHVDLHYLSGELHLELYLPISVVTHDMPAEHIESEYRKALAAMVDVGSIRILYVAQD